MTVQIGQSISNLTRQFQNFVQVIVLMNKERARRSNHKKFKNYEKAEVNPSWRIYFEFSWFCGFIEVLKC